LIFSLGMINWSVELVIVGRDCKNQAKHK
jgi:hypothetical protein